MGVGIFILQCLYLMIPGYFGNMAPVIVKKRFKFLAISIHKKWFGKNKTWRGMIFGTLFGILSAYIQFLIGPNALVLIDYSNWLAIGALMGFGAVFGDLVESFIKRRLNRKPGEKFFPWDQLDFVFGSLLFTFMFIPENVRMNVIIVLLLFSPLLHIIVNHCAFYLKIRNEKW